MKPALTRREAPCVLAICALILAGSSAAAQESETYVADRISLTTGAGVAGSQRFDNAAVVSPVSPAGHAVACGGVSLARFGFWSVLGAADLPILLVVDRDATDRNAVHLVWTGSEPGYRIYRGDLPDRVLDPGNLLSETTSCDVTDPPTPAADVLFYLVVAQP